jgi:hypothetical protein
MQVEVRADCFTIRPNRTTPQSRNPHRTGESGRVNAHQGTAELIHRMALDLRDVCTPRNH